MTTKIIAPQEVTMEMLVAGVESNETATKLPSRFQLVNDEIRYSVKYPTGDWTFAAWEHIDAIAFEEIKRYMKADTDADTIWTTPIVEVA